MKMNDSLKQRISRAFIVLSIVLAGFFCVVSYTAVEVIESQVIDARLEKVADTLISHHLKHEAFDLPPEITFFANTSIPPALHDKEEGLHEVMLDGREVVASIRVESGNRYAIVQEMTEFEHTEFIIFSSLAAGFLSSVLLAVILGFATGRRIVAPVTALADAVSASAAPSALPSIDANDEIGVLARAFARHTNELQQFLMREREFTGDVSHELRTPLTIMLGAAELLQSQLSDRPAQQAIAERLRRVTAETAERVSALLWLARAPEKLGVSSIAVGPIIKLEMERYEPLLAHKPVRYCFEETEQVYVNARPELVGIAIGNLIRNACQHTEEGEIILKLEPAKFTITDTGPGIPDSVRERLFERFVQGRRDSSEGTGLGLSIVKRVAEHLGWEVRLEQHERTGTCFSIIFATDASARA